MTFFLMTMEKNIAQDFSRERDEGGRCQGDEEMRCDFQLFSRQRLEVDEIYDKEVGKLPGWFLAFIFGGSYS